MSLASVDWRYMPTKNCLMACPPGHYCECSARMDWEMSWAGQEWKKEQKDLRNKSEKDLKEYKEFKETFEDI